MDAAGVCRWCRGWSQADRAGACARRTRVLDARDAAAAVRGEAQAGRAHAAERTCGAIDRALAGVRRRRAGRGASSSGRTRRTPGCKARRAREASSSRSCATRGARRGRGSARPSGTPRGQGAGRAPDPRKERSKNLIYQGRAHDYHRQTAHLGRSSHPIPRSLRRRC